MWHSRKISLPKCADIWDRKEVGRLYEMVENHKIMVFQTKMERRIVPDRSLCHFLNKLCCFSKGVKML